MNFINKIFSLIKNMKLRYKVLAVLIFLFALWVYPYRNALDLMFPIDWIVVYIILGFFVLGLFFRFALSLIDNKETRKISFSCVVFLLCLSCMYTIFLKGSPSKTNFYKFTFFKQGASQSTLLEERKTPCLPGDLHYPTCQLASQGSVKMTLVDTKYKYDVLAECENCMWLKVDQHSRIQRKFYPFMTPDREFPNSYSQGYDEYIINYKADPTRRSRLGYFYSFRADEYLVEVLNNQGEKSAEYIFMPVFVIDEYSDVVYDD